MIVISRTADIEQQNLKAKVPDEILQEVKRIAMTLDELYGGERDEFSDGGIILVAEKKSDLKTIKAKYASLDENDCEGEDIIVTSQGNYVNQLYLRNNEFGVNVIMPERLIYIGRKVMKA